MRDLNDPLMQQLIAAAAPHRVEITLDMTPTYGNATPRQRLGYGYSKTTFWAPAYSPGPLTDEILTDLIAYFTNRPVDEETIMNIYSTDLFTYLAGDMIGQSTVTLTIDAVSLESMNSGKGGSQTKPCLHFRERSKLMVLNKTNAKFIAAEIGAETDDWAGARVTIAAPVIDAFGKSARSLRVIKVEPANVAKPHPRPTGNGTATAPNDDALFDAAHQPTLAGTIQAADPA